MSDDVVRVEGLWKRYDIHPVHTLWARAADLGRRLSGRPRREDDFWALRDVNFRVRRGETLGVIGPNGAGKSTLLKVLCGVTAPTRGSVEVRGRVAPLIELGAGFHPELTGRENVLINGVMLGMSLREVRSKYDRIVEFSGLEDFMDTPVKKYSSGMFVRLGFSVAVHTDPDVLLVDEVLAVGDAAFQARCFDHMARKRREGRTTVFVSHNMGAISGFTERCIWLDSGRIRASGETAEVVRKYLQGVDQEIPAGAADLSSRPRQGRKPILTRIEVLQEGRVAPAVKMGSPVAFRVSLKADAPIESPLLGIGVDSRYGGRVVSLGSLYAPDGKCEAIREGHVTCEVGSLPLNQGKYFLTVTLSRGHPANVLDRVESACYFEVAPADVFGSGHIPDRGQGVMYWPARWRWQEAGAVET